MRLIININNIKKLKLCSTHPQSDYELKDIDKI